MKNNKLTTALTVLGLFCVNLLLAQTSISGTVTDAEQMSLYQALTSLSKELQKEQIPTLTETLL